MIPQSKTLIETISRALPRFLADRMAALDVDAALLDEEITAATLAAEVGLGELLSLPFDRQREAPLEVVRRGIEPVTAALLERGVTPPQRDEEANRVAPDDVFGIVPASAAELGDDALEASLAWGLAKTAALSRPLLLVVTKNLMDGSRFESMAAASGYRLEVRRDTASGTTPLVAFVDLELEGSDDVIRRLVDAGVRVVAYGPHVDEFALVRARSLGATAAEPRSRVFRSASEYLPPLV